MIEIDGARGEGGGQILRTSLSASLCLQRPFRIVRIRSRRRPPGLRPQHLAAVRAAAEISAASVRGEGVGSTELEFAPGPVRCGAYRFDIGTAGSATLVVQTLLPALLTGGGPSELEIRGGTHNPHAPTYEFLASAFLPVLAQMGADCEPQLIRAGFYPAGGGQMRLRIRPVARLSPLRLLERGEVLQTSAQALLANLPEHVGYRELSVLRERLGWPAESLRVVRAEAHGPGNVLSASVRCRHVTELFTAFGRRGLPAEQVAADVADDVQAWLAAGVPVGRHLADQLLIPLMLAGGAFQTVTPSSHTRTNLDIIEQWTESRFDCEQLATEVWKISRPSGTG